MMAVAGDAMVKARGLLLLLSAGMYAAFGRNIYFMFPIAFAGLAGLFAIAAGGTDERKAHF